MMNSEIRKEEDIDYRFGPNTFFYLCIKLQKEDYNTNIGGRFHRLLPYYMYIQYTYNAIKLFEAVIYFHK